MTNIGPFSVSGSQESDLLDADALSELERQMCFPMNDFLEHDVLDTAETKCDPMYIPAQQQMNIPVTEEFPGPFDFQLKLKNDGAGKHCVFSLPLQKIFINMEQTLPLRFEWRPTMPGHFVRATMVFSHDQSRSDPVLRCHNHMAAQNIGNTSVRPDILKHVVRCLDPESIYNERNGHLSVVVPLRMPQAGSDYVQVNYQFYCKNSCTSGMNRRPTELIFELENQLGEVLGRRKLCVRVCSCPKRDKEKEEAEQHTGKVRVSSAKKRKITTTPAPPGKKLMVPGVQDSREYMVQFKIPGRENYQAVLKQAFDLMAGQALRTGQHEFMKPYMEELLQKMQ